MRILHGSGPTDLTGVTGQLHVSWWFRQYLPCLALQAGGPALTSISSAHLFPALCHDLEEPLGGGAGVPAGVSSYGVRRPPRSAAQGDLTVPFSRTPATMHQRAFLVVGPLMWNWLPLQLRCLPQVVPSPFKGFLINSA